MSTSGPSGNPEYIEWLHPNNKLNLYELCVITCMHNDVVRERDQVFIGNQREQLQKEPAQVPSCRNRAR